MERGMGLFAAAGLGFYLCFFHWRNNLPLDHAVYRGVLKRFYLQPDALLSVLVHPHIETPIIYKPCLRKFTT